MSFDFGDEISLALQDLQARVEMLSVRSTFAHVQDIEDVASPKIGELYFVQVARPRQDSFSPRGGFIPTLGPPHDDTDFIGSFPEPVHHHCDWRFFPRGELYSQFVKMATEQFTKNQETYGWDANTPNVQLAFVIPSSWVVAVERWPLPLQRPQLRWEVIPDWLAPLEEAHKDARVCNDICPHRGLTLNGCPEDANGVRRCAGHGLQWSREGRLVPRCKVD
jgi:hypothetical protein